MFAADILTAGVQFSILQTRTAFRCIGYATTPPPETQISADHCLKFWVIMLLERLKFLAPEQRALLTEEVVNGLTGLADAIQAGTVQTPMVVIADSRYATWHNHVGWLDLTNGTTVPAPQHPPLETVAFHLAVMFHRNRAACAELTRRKVLQDASTSNSG